ncbi:MAG: ATP/GTP-binding protein [Nitrososphaerota archaeon]|nr:ATP/GTP-binding protein [Candidatus Bathyarchaeota archaeon]MDW8049282.1 ATP/GTP-binding protein [Nitrososphaerota archaeon]
MVFTAFIIGTAGSGKSYLTAALTERMLMDRQKVATLNLDPGVVNLPYTPDIDIRNYISIESIMEKYNLGPNGALIMAADLIADEIDLLKEEIEDLDPDILIVDTPGQMELFAFRASGPFIAQTISEDEKAIVYLFDSVFSLNPLNYVSNMFLSAAVHVRFLLPQIHVLSKCDLIPEADLDRVLEWSEDYEALESAINENLEGTKRLLTQRMGEAIHQLELSFPLIPVSAQTHEGLIELNAMLERVFKGGEKITY